MQLRDLTFPNLQRAVTVASGTLAEVTQILIYMLDAPVSSFDRR